MIRTESGDKKSYGFPLHVAAIRLVAAKVAGWNIDRVSVVARHNNWAPAALTDAGYPIDPCQIRTVTLGDGIDPLDRLRQWCQLACEALEARRGLFGLRDSRRDDRWKTFESFIAAKNHDSGTARYPLTPEAIAYGLWPIYTDIFYEKSPESLFLDRFTSLFRIQTIGMTYVLQ